MQLKLAESNSLNFPGEAFVFITVRMQVNSVARKQVNKRSADENSNTTTSGGEALLRITKKQTLSLAWACLGSLR